MLQDILNKDIISEYLFKKTNFTKTQLDTLLISLMQDKKLELNMKIKLRDKGEVSKGSFIRTLRQAQRNLERSLYTIIILEYLSVLNENDFYNLIRIGKALRKIKEQNVGNERVQVILEEVSSVISSVCGKN